MCAAYETSTAVMSEEALAEREHARRGHDALEGMTHAANGAAEAVVLIEEEEPVKPGDLDADVDEDTVKVGEAQIPKARPQNS